MYLVKFKNKKDLDLVKKLNIEIIEEFDRIPGILGIEGKKEDIKKLEKMEQVASIEHDAQDEFDDDVFLVSEQQEEYSIEMLGVKKFWENGITGKGIKVAVLDGGGQLHEDLIYAGGVNIQNPNETIHSDYRDHGTHVAGIIGMQHNDVGWVGVAPEAEIYVVKMDNNRGGGNTQSAQIAAVSWCIDNDMDIICMSISSTEEGVARNEAFRVAAEEYGIICCTSAGNTDRGAAYEEDTIRYPAKLPYVVGCGSVDNDEVKAESSSKGEGLDVVGPGVNIHSTLPDRTKGISKRYGTKSGTSMSTPAIAGMFALYKEMHPELRRQELIDKVKDNAKPLGDKRLYGAGLVQPPEDLHLMKNSDLRPGQVLVIRDSRGLTEELIRRESDREVSTIFTRDESGYVTTAETGEKEV